MKHKFFITVWLFALLIGCSNDEKIIYNTTITPDLSNPLIQKLTASKWYRTDMQLGSLSEKWTTTNFNSPSDVAESMLYSFAWLDIQFLRNGTSLMTFKPPLFPNSFVVCKGKWKVSETEENTVVLQTKTPASYATIRFKITNFESKENVSLISVEMDTGSRLIVTNLMNALGMFESHPTYVNINDYEWLETKKVSKKPLVENDFTGAWTNSNFVRDYNAQGKSETIIVSTYIEDLMMRTPTFVEGMQFNLMKGGKARLAYGKSSGTYSMFRKYIDNKQLYSDATWKVEGNKIIIETNENIFYAAGAGLGFTITNLIDLKPIKEDVTPIIYLWKNYYYVMELMEYDKEKDAYLFRITAKDSTHYLYLKKTDINYEGEEWINVKNVYNK